MIELLVACIASGKSTYAAKRAKEDCIIINDDSLVESLHGGNYQLYNKKLKPLYSDLANHAMILANQLGKDIVIDRCNLDIKRRKRYIDFAKNILKTAVICTCFKIETPEEHAKRRYWSDGRGYTYDYWLKVCRSHLEEYTPPSLDEGFSEIREVHYATGFMTPAEEMEVRST